MDSTNLYVYYEMYIVLKFIFSIQISISPSYLFGTKVEDIFEVSPGITVKNSIKITSINLKN